MGTILERGSHSPIHSTGLLGDGRRCSLPDANLGDPGRRGNSILNTSSGSRETGIEPPYFARYGSASDTSARKRPCSCSKALPIQMRPSPLGGCQGRYPSSLARARVLLTIVAG